MERKKEIERIRKNQMNIDSTDEKKSSPIERKRFFSEDDLRRDPKRSPTRPLKPRSPADSVSSSSPASSTYTPSLIFLPISELPEKEKAE